MLEAIVRITPPHSWIRRVTSSFPAEIRVLDCRAIPKRKGVQELFEITSAPEFSEKILDFLHQDDYVYDLDVIKGKAGKIIGSLNSKVYRLQNIRWCELLPGFGNYQTRRQARMDPARKRHNGPVTSE